MYVRLYFSSGSSYPGTVPTFALTSAPPGTTVSNFNNSYCATYSSFAQANIYCARISGTNVAAWSGTLQVTGSYTKAGGSGSGSATAKISLVVAGAAATKLGMTQQPVGGGSGAALQVQPWIAIQDATGATATGSTAAVTVTSSGGTLGGTTSVNAVSGIAKFTNLTLAGVAGTSYTLTFTSSGLTSVTSSSVLVTFGAASKVSISTAPVLGSSGSVMATQPVITIQDAQGNTVTSSSATVTVSIASGSSGTLSGTQFSSGVSAVNGIATFTNLAFSTTNSGNSYTFTFASTGLTSATSSPGIQVSGAASKIGIYTLPILGSSGYALAQMPVIAIQDANGNTVTSDNSTVVTISGTGISGTTTATASGGFATFSSLIYTGSGSVTLTFSATLGGTYKTATTGSLAVAGAANKISVSRQPVASTNGALLATQPVVRIEDSNGQLVTASSATVTASVVGSGGYLTNSSSVTAVASGGIATFANLKLNGLVGTQYEVAFASGALTSGTSGYLSVTSGAASKLAISIAPVGSSSGSALATQPQIQLEDIDGNFVSTNSVNVNASIYSGASGTLGGTTSKSTSSGLAAFTDLTLTGLTTETYVLKFDSTGLTQVLSGSVTVTEGSVSLSNALISADASSVNADGTATVAVTVQARDAQGNSVASSAGTLVLSVSGGGSISTPTDNSDGTYSATYTAGSSAGTATISGSLAGTPITDTVQISLVSPNSNLSSLSATGASLSPSFSSGTTTYTSTVPYTTSSITVTPTTAESHATVTVNGNPVTSASASGAISLTAGSSSTITIVVTAQNGTTTTYSIAVTRTAAATDATLSGLTVTTATLSPSFASATTSYTASVPYTTSTVTVTPTVNESHATVTVNGASVTSASASGNISLTAGAATNLTVVVTAQNGTTKTYTVAVTRAAVSNVATLSALTLSSGTLSPSFASGTSAYTASVASATSSITVTPTVTFTAATIQAKVGSGSYSSVTSGSASGSLALAYGDNTITVLVTAQDGTTTGTYSVVVNRPLITRSISFTSPPASLTYGSTASLSASPSAGISEGTVSYSAGSSTGCSVLGSTLSVTNATGTCAITATVSAGATYAAATTSSTSVTLNKATLRVTAASPSVVYGAAVPTITPTYNVGDLKGSDAIASLAGLVAPTCSTLYTTSTNAGSTPATTCTGGSATNYSFSFTAGSVTINKADPVITWDTPLPIHAGNLTSAELDAAASLPGSLVFTPSLGSAVAEGTRTLSVTFTPTDSTNYNVVSKSVNLVVTGATAPNAPNAPTITNVGVTTSSSLAITWTPVSDSNNGGSTITSYQYRFSLAGASLSWSNWANLVGLSGSSESITVTSTSKSYVAQIRACNVVGCSSASIASSAATSTGIIVSAPVTPTVSATLATNGTVTVAYSKDSGTTSYSYSTDDGASWRSVTGTTGSFTFTATKGTSHKIRVRGVNASGNGSASNSASILWTTIPAVPTSVTGAASTSGDAKITIDVNESDNGGLFTWFEYSYGSADGDGEEDNTNYGAAVNAGASEPFDVSVSNANGSYRVKVRACNSVGCSSYSSAVKVTSSRARITTQPAGTTLTVGQSATYSVSVVAQPAASEAITYNWYKNGVIVATGGTNSSYAVSTASAGTFTYRVVVHAGSVDLTSDTATVVVNPAPTMTTTLTGATVGLSYSYNLVPSGGTPNYTYTIGTLPSGLSYSSENKRISGTVSNSVTPGTKTFTCRITDSSGVYTDATCSITISLPITITTTTLGAASKGSTYSATLAVSGGTAPYTWTLNTGSSPLPTGITLSTGGVISSGVSNVPDAAASATIEVLVTDANGVTDTQKLTLNVLAGIPNAPRTPAATGANKSVILTWTDPEAKSGVTITNFIISYVKPKGEHSDDGGNDDEERGSISIDGSLNTYTVTGLTNGLPYTFTISAKSSGGTGSPSAPVTATPLGKATPPQSVSAANGRNGISVRWKKPNENGGGSISTWVIVCTSSTEVITKTFGEGDGGEERGDDGQNRYVVYSNDDPESSRHLIPGHAYTCTVAAKTTKNGNTTIGDPSSPSASVLFATVPSMPPTLSGTYNSDSRTVTATWTASTDDGGSAITQYIAYMQQGDGEESKRQCFTSDTGTTCTINNISGKGNYDLHVVAVNAIGQSDDRTYNVTVTGKTQTITIPSLPDRIIGSADFNVGATSSAGLNLSYSSSTSDKCSVTSKGGLVKMLKVGLCTISVSQNGHKSDEHGDDKGEESEYGSVAGTASFNILDRVPSAPTVTTVLSGDTQLTINWTAPESTGGTPSGYQVAVVLASCGADKTACTYNESSTVAASPLTLVVTSLTNGSPYYVRVRAINAAGSSAYSYGTSSYKPYGKPGAPSITGITTSAETSTATITWSSSAANGSPISGYTVVASPSGKTCTTGGTLTCSISGLTNGVTYTFTVYGTNAAGNGPASSGSTATIAMVSQTIQFNNPIPGKYGYTVGDPNVQFNATASSGLPIQWSTVDANICTVTSGGSVRLLSAGACEVIIAQNGKDATGAQTKYGVATYTTNSKQIIIEPATPSAPVITSITNTPSGLVILWNRPSRAGGTLTYSISGVNGSNTTGCADTSVESCTATPSIKGMSYAFTVVAKNSAGNSPVSNTKFGTWVVAPSAPRTPGTAIANSTDGRAIDLTWNLSADDGGESITRYVATATEGSNSTTCSVTRTSTLDTNGYSCTLTGLKAAVQYSVTVVSMNSAGNSPTLSLGNVTPGLSQTITLNSPTASTMTKPISSADFVLDASASSGKALTFSTTDTSYCTINSTSGLVHLVAVGTCVVTVSQAGSTLANSSQFLAASATVTITITPVAPSAATITKVTPGDGQLTIEWTPAANNGGAVTTESVTVTNSAGQAVGSCTYSGHTAVCTGLSNGQIYNIVVNTSNSQGTTPSAPASGIPFYNALSPLPLTAVGGVRSIDVSWQAPAQVDSDKTLHHYLVQIYDGANWQTAITTSDSSTVTGTITQLPITLAALLNGTTYTLRAIAVATKTGSDFYNGVPTGDVLAATLDLPSKPLAVTATSIGSSITLSWQAPSSNGGSTLSGYSIRKTYLGSTATSSASSSANSATFSAVAGGTYTFVINASNSVGAGPVETVTVTALNVPGIPVITNVTPNNSNGSASVTWTAPTSGPAPTSYTAVVYQNGVATAITCTVSATVELTCNLTGLSYKIPYTIVVYATNAAGNGSNSVSSTTFTLHKGQTITFGVIANKSFSLGSLALTATASSGLAVTYTSTTTPVCTTTAGSSTVTFVKAGSCSITASQDGVGSDFDDATSVTQTFTITAETPSSLVLTTVDPGAFKLHATWSPAVDLGGSTLDYYVLSWATNADFSDEDQMTVLAANSDITSLIQLQQYRVRVQVVAKSGLSSDWSNVLLGTPYGLPAAPTAVVASQLGTGIVQVSWTNSVSDGGTPIIGYTVTAYNATTGVATTFTCTAASITCNVSGLAGSVNYYFKVAATNSVGSATSLPSNNVQPGESQTITPNNSTVSHGVSPFANGATVNSGLALAFARTSQTNAYSAPSFDPTWGAGRSVCTIAADGTVTVDLAGTCYIQVSQNGTIEGTVGGTPSSFLAATSVVESVTVSASAPNVTTGLLLSPADGHIDASWIAPTDDGGSPIVKYIVIWYVTANSKPSDADLDAARVAGNTSDTRASYGELWFTTTGTTPLATACDLVGLVNGTTYTVEVTAVNAAGLIGAVK